jgi:hypothetical protein
VKKAQGETVPILIDANNMKLVGECGPLIVAGVVKPVAGLTLSEANQGESYARLLLAQSGKEEQTPERPSPTEIRRTDMRAIGTWASTIAAGKTRLVD